MRGLSRVACVLLLATTSSLFAAPPVVTAPEKVYAEAGDWAFFTVTTDGKGTRAVPVTAGLKRFPAEKLKDPNEFGFRATVPGTYQVLVYSGNAEGASEPKYVTVVFGGAPGPAPPDPGPKPPDPPIPPAPVDPLVKLLADAYATEVAADRRERVRALAAVMHDAAGLALDHAITTNAALAGKVTDRRREKVGDSLPAVRKAIGQYLGGEFPAEPVSLDADLRARFKAAYTKLGKALEEVGK